MALLTPNRTIYLWSQKLIFLACICLIGYFIKRPDFYTFYGLLLVCFVIFYSLVSQNSSNNHLFIIGLVARIILLFATPELSDDFYRFLWDGALICKGINPFTILPTEVYDQKLLDIAYLNLFPFLNSPNYYTVYPSIIQIINSVSILIGQNTFGAMITMKLIFLGFDILSFIFLKKILNQRNKPQQKAYLYWLCPLVILEFVGNVHHECIMIAFILAALYYLRSKKNILSGLFLGLAILTKLTPLLFIPFFMFRLSLKENVFFLTPLAIISAVLSLPIMVDNGYLYFMKSINLYFSTFEFNSSFYQIVGFMNKWFGDIRLIYKLGVIIALTIWFWKWQINKVETLGGITIAYLIYVLSAQSVHPWYIIPLLPFLLIHQVPTYYWVWLLLIPLTYITYITVAYEQKVWVSLVEYGCVGVFLVLEIISKQNSSQKVTHY